MRTLIYTAFVSVDGVVQAPGPEADYPNGGWTFQGIDFLEEVYELKAREQEEASALMLGRVSYQAFAPVWPKMTTEFPKYNAMPKYVVSTTLQDEDLVDNWGDTTILRTFADVAALKETDGGPISIHGSASLARGLADAGLLDRYHLLVFPWVLGEGKRMWSETAKDRQKLALVESETYTNGVQKLCYDVVR
ncbi:dihydrofolate reductase family protein [Nocardioides sp. CPCC 206347]|uniref:dihydrofolate reductase family protein n=1 Tax=Nocardioides sp. CPCC 206347 TaxID=3406463 RepID=UPI003B429359